MAASLLIAGTRGSGWHSGKAHSSSQNSEVLPLDIMLPSDGLGALALEIRDEDDTTRRFIGVLYHEETGRAVVGESTFLRFLEGGCQISIGTHDDWGRASRPDQQ